MTTVSEHDRPSHRRFWRAIATLVVLIVALNLLGFVPGVCDLYATHVYPVITDPLSRLCDATRAPIGEYLMFGGIALVALALIATVLLAIFHKRQHFAALVHGYLKFVLVVVLCTLFMFTINYLLPLRATPLINTYTASNKVTDESGSAFTLEQLEALRTQVVQELNAAAEGATRDNEGHMVHSDDVDEKVSDALQGIASEFPRLAGYYPTPKAAMCSDVLEWMGIGGYTYPYTMEVTYNRYVSRLYYPVLSAHESVHHKGYYLESEAEFLSYLACTRSDDIVLRYSGYENMYYHLDRAYQGKLLGTYSKEEARNRYYQQPQLSDLVKADIEHDAEERAQAYEANVDKAAEELLSGAAEEAAQYGWDTQAQLLQGNSYSGVVELLLAYTYGDERS